MSRFRQKTNFLLHSSIECASRNYIKGFYAGKSIYFNDSKRLQINKCIRQQPFRKFTGYKIMWYIYFFIPLMKVVKL